MHSLTILYNTCTAWDFTGVLRLNCCQYIQQSPIAPETIYITQFLSLGHQIFQMGFLDGSVTGLRSTDCKESVEVQRQGKVLYAVSVAVCG